jgi:hypothetical protein
LRSRAQAQSDDFGVVDVLYVLGGCARAHLLDVAPELMSELETHSRAFICNYSRCSLGTFRWGSYGRRDDMGVVMDVGISVDVTDATAPS